MRHYHGNTSNTATSAFFDPVKKAARGSADSQRGALNKWEQLRQLQQQYSFIIMHYRRQSSEWELTRTGLQPSNIVIVRMYIDWPIYFFFISAPRLFFFRLLKVVIAERKNWFVLHHQFRVTTLNWIAKFTVSGMFTRNESQNAINKATSAFGAATPKTINKPMD